MRERSRTFFEAFPPREGRFPFSRQEREAFLDQNREPYAALMDALKGLETEFAAVMQKPEELTRLARRSFELRQELAFLFESSEKNFVYWFERRNKGVFLAATPIDVSQILRERLFEQFDTVVLTSATLTWAGGLIHQAAAGAGPRERTDAAAGVSLWPAGAALFAKTDAGCARHGVSGEGCG